MASGEPSVAYPGHKGPLDLFQLINEFLAGRRPKLTAVVKVRLHQRLKQGKEKKRTSPPECPEAPAHHLAC
jgi:hypothetical protein